MNQQRTDAASIETLLLRADRPLYIVSPQTQILFFNRACEKLTGWPQHGVLGLHCRAESPAAAATVDALAASLCPPGAAFEGQSCCWEAQIPSASGEVHTRTISFHPCREQSGKLLAILAMVQEPQPAGSTDEPATAPLAEQLQRLRTRLVRRYGFDQLVCSGHAMQRVLAQVKATAGCNAPVWITGERGTGKQLLARTIHYAGARREQPFMPIECAALPPEVLGQTLRELLEAEQSHAPTYALPHSAPPGTVFLREVLHLPRDHQAQLLPLLEQDPSDDAPGSGRPRLIAATSEDPEAALSEGRLREDFYYACTPLTIGVPPLRRRLEDLPLLIQHLLEQQADEADPAPSLDDDAWEALTTYDWPGNVQELADTIAGACRRASGSQLRAADLPHRVRNADQRDSPAEDEPQTTLALDDLLLRVESRLIRLALQRARGNKSRAAEVLGISRPRLYRRMEALGILDESPGPDRPDEP